MIIVVTGEKIERSLQTTVSSVAVLTGEDLQRSAIDSLNDSFAYIANVNLSSVEGGFAIRGIPFDNLLGAGSAPLSQIYVDDVTIGDQATRFGVDSIWDVAQLEVLRGAQSTVQGRNALAGAIIVRTQDPTFEWTGTARGLVIGSEHGDEYSAAAALGGPIIDDVLAFRVSLERREADGFVSNATTGAEGDDYGDRWQARGKLLFTPRDDVRALLTVAWGDTTTANRLIDRRTYNAQGYVAQPETLAADGLSRRLSFIDAPDYNRNTSKLASLNVAWNVTDALTLTSITAYSDSRNDEELDTDQAFLDPALLPAGPVVVNNPFGVPYVPARMDRFTPAGTQLEDQTIFTQELVASYDAGGRIRGLGGLYYHAMEEQEYNFTPALQPGLYGVIESATRPGVEATLRGVFGPLRGIPAPGNPVAGIPAGAAGDPFFNAFIGQTTNLTVNAILANYSDFGAFVAVTSEPLEVTNWAAYASGEYDLTDKITLGAGVRYDSEEQVEGLTLSGDPLGMPNPARPFVPAGFPASLVPIVQGSIVSVNAFFNQTLAEAQTSTEKSFDAVLPSAFVRYTFDDDRSLSLSVRRGYRAGGSDLNIPRQFVSTFEPEYTWNYELALRSYWFDRSLLLNANAFYIDWTDQQMVVSLSTLQQDEVGFNVGKSVVKGLELDASWFVSDAWSAQLAVGYVDTEFKDFDAALATRLIEAQRVTAPISLEQTLAAFEGRAFSFAPELTGAVRLNYQGANGVFGTLGVTYEGESFVNNANSSAPGFLNNDARTLVNLTVGYERDGYSVSVLARNLLDEEYVASGGRELVRLGSPRQIGLRVQKSF